MTKEKMSARDIVTAAVMMHEPPMIILDEPTSGLDFDSMEKVRELIQDQ